MLDIATESSPRKASKELCARIYHTHEHGGHGFLPGAGPRAFPTFIHFTITTTILTVHRRKLRQKGFRDM